MVGPWNLRGRSRPEQCVDLFEDGGVGQAVGLGQGAAVDPGEPALHVQPPLLTVDEDRHDQQQGPGSSASASTP